ncbi:Uncharacterized conserved protein, Ntn-hydrolase superfamily [Salinimicrobium sediminis]|uniref:Uncharacterized conserved protein, Ntn-hydrolase superfamily n=2 Tax=Salinimicrobium sediminis TaxID=1343891 RepID=A0A285X2L6_9FLAO|nr:Uncharacterized conserved protein, Ntn-hydrolase superfamily [Salinimicrobium sediminis]
MRLFLVLLCCLPLSSKVSAQTAEIMKDPFAHTYSIVARDAKTGEMAVGVQSHWFSVGSIVSWGKAGVGVVATQSFVNPAYGPNGLKLMEQGLAPAEALTILLALDEGKAYRQVAFLNANGETAVHTGEKCVEAAGDFAAENFSVQANMMLNDKVVPAMKKAFLEHENLPLAERVLKVLQAAEAAGGDIRGKQSAALIVVGAEEVEHPWEEKKIDLRVDDHAEPLVELERLLKVARAYEFMNRGDLAMEAANVEKALEEYGGAMELFPENLEMKYWTAVALANSGRMDEAKPLFEAIFKADPNWKEMTRRLPASGLLNISKKELEELTK